MVSILQKADENEELYNQTTDRVLEVIRDEMIALREALRSKIDIMYDDNTDDFISKYIQANYNNKVEPGKNEEKQQVDSISTAIAIMKSSLCIVLKSVGNPDFKQYASISPTKVIPVATLAEAQMAANDYINKYDLGGGNWDGGQVYHPTKGLIAHLSYNLRVWKGEYWGKTEAEEYLKTELLKTWKEL